MHGYMNTSGNILTILNTSDDDPIPASISATWPSFKKTLLTTEMKIKGIIHLLTADQHIFIFIKCNIKKENLKG